MSTAIILRPLQPDDGPALAELATQSPDTGQITFASHFQIDAYRTFMALHDEVVGVVALLPDSERIVGQRQIENQVRPCALLNTLIVHPAYRQRGIAAQLTQWRATHARERMGAQGVILASIQKNNTGSERTAQQWCRQLIGQPVTTLVRIRDEDSYFASALTMLQ